MHWIIDLPFIPGIIAPAIAGTIAAISAAVAAAGSIAGGVMSVISSKQQGEAAKQAAEYNAAVAKNDAIAAQNAAAYEARQIRRKNLLRLGAQRADIAKSGVSLDAGSSFDDVMFDSAVQGELEAQAALYTGTLRSRAQGAQAAMSLYEGRQARRAAGIGMASGIIGGIGGLAQAGGMYAQASQPRFNSESSGPTWEKGKAGFPIT